LTEQTEPDAKSVDPKLEGIGGWLIVPAIWIGLNSILGGVAISISLVKIIKATVAGYGVTISVEYIVVLGLWVLLVYTLILFIGRKSKTPLFIIIFLVANIAGSLLLLAIESGAGTDMSASENRVQLVRDIIIAAIWIPYFRRSMRVKATFVN